MKDKNPNVIMIIKAFLEYFVNWPLYVECMALTDVAFLLLIIGIFFLLIN